MNLSTSEKARYWGLLMNSAQQYMGSASLGNKAYQHLGIILGIKPSPRAQEVLTEYARAEAVSDKPEDLFDAFINTHRVRATGPAKAKGRYFEFWSSYAGTQKADTDPDRQTLLDQLEAVAAYVPPPPRQIPLGQIKITASYSNGDFNARVINFSAHAIDVFEASSSFGSCDEPFFESHSLDDIEEVFEEIRFEIIRLTATGPKQFTLDVSPTLLVLPEAVELGKIPT